MDPRDLKQASKLINNQLASRGLLRGGKSIPFHKPSEDDTTPAKIINIIHELIARRDVEEEERESLAMTLRLLRTQETKQAEIIESLKAKNADLARRNGLLESASRSFDHTLRTSEAAQRTLRDEATRIKTVLGQVRTQCANDIRKRDVQITKLKERLTDTRPRGQRAQHASCTIINPANLDASSRAEEETSNIAQETADFLTTLSQNLADENDNLIALVRTTLSTLKAIQGLPDDDHFAQEEDQDEERPVVALPADFDKFTTELDQVLFSLKEMLNQPNYVPLEDLAVKEAEITRLVAKNEMLEIEWKKAIALVDEWNRTLSRGFTQGVGGEQREKALAQSEDILKNSPKKVGSPRRSVMEVFKERGMDEEEYEEEEEMNGGMRAVLSMVQEEDEEDEEEKQMEPVAEEVEEEVQVEGEETEVEAGKEMDEEVHEEAEQEPEPAVEETEQKENEGNEEQEENEGNEEQEEPEVEQTEDQEEIRIEQQTSQTEELVDEDATQEMVVVQSLIKSSKNQPKSRSTPTPTLTPEPQPTPASKRKSSNAKDIPFRQLFEDREIATKSPSMVPKPITRRRGSTLTALDEPEEITEAAAKKGRRKSRKEEATLPEEEVTPLPAVSKSTAKPKAPTLSKAPVLSKTSAVSKTPSRKSPRKGAARATPELDASARQLVQEGLQATPARVLEIKKNTTRRTRRTRSTSLAAEAEKAQTDAEDPPSGQDAPQSRSRRQTRRAVAEEVTMIGETTEISALESIMVEDSAPKLKLRPRASRNRKEPEPEAEDLDMLLSKAIRDESEAPEPEPESEPVPKRSVRGRKKAAGADTTVETTMLEDTFEGVSKKSDLRRRSLRHKKPTENENILAELSAPEPVHYEEIPNAVQVVAVRDGPAEEEVGEEKEGAGGAKLSRARRKSLRNRDKYPRDGQENVAEPVPVPVEASPSVPKRKRKSTADREGQKGLRISPRKRVARSVDV